MSASNTWPKTVEEALDQLLLILSPEDKVTIKATAKEDLTDFHFGLGLYLRNEFGLWGGNTELLKACSVLSSLPPPLASQPDTASSSIIEQLWRKLNQAE